jgi:vacuolar iron transporter family protein
VDDRLRTALLVAQRTELTEHVVYSRLAARTSDAHNRAVLERIAADEKSHHDFLQRETGREVRPRRLVVGLYLAVARVLGLTFTAKLMERGEERARDSYELIADRVPGARQLMEDEDRHERELTDLIDEERLRYAGSVVLGLNDALVELTGALAGLTFALSDGRLIAAAGLVTGIAASLSMAASEYLSTKSEEDGRKHPLKAAIYTGSAYVGAVALLILPFFVLKSPFWALPVTIAVSVLLILGFTVYISVAKDRDFRRPFLEMAGISLGVAAISFGVGFGVKAWLGVDG